MNDSAIFLVFMLGFGFLILAVLSGIGFQILVRRTLRESELDDFEISDFNKYDNISSISWWVRVYRLFYSLGEFEGAQMSMTRHQIYRFLVKVWFLFTFAAFSFAGAALIFGLLEVNK